GRNGTAAGLTANAMQNYSEECKQLVLGLTAGEEATVEHGSPGATGAATLSPAAAGVYDALAAFQAERLGPYLEGGRHSGSSLTARGETDQQVRGLRARLPAPAHPRLHPLE